MQKIKIKGTNLLTTRKGSGCIALGREPWPPVDNTIKGKRPTERVAVDIIKALYLLGERYFDTATDAYELATERIALALGELQEKGEDIQEIIISDKFGERFGRELGCFAQKAGVYDFSEDALYKMLEKSLKMFGREALDIVFTHLPWDDDLEKMQALEIKELCSGTSGDALRKAKKEGLIKYIGVSADTTGAAKKAITQGYDVIMLNYSIMNQDAERAGVLTEALERNTGIVVRQPYEWGKVFGVNLANKKDCLKFEKLKKIAEQSQLSLVELALKFILQHPGVDVVIPGSKSFSNIVSNFKASQGEPLAAEIYAELKNI